MNTTIQTQQPENQTFSLAEVISEHVGHTNRVDTAIKGLSLHRWDEPTEPTSYMMPPSICLVGQGQKRLFLNQDAFVFDPHTFLITSVELPVFSQILEASETRPYLGLTMELNLRVISELMLDHPGEINRSSENRRSVAVSPLTDEILNAFTRLVGLLKNKEDVSALAPLIQQEILYRLLKSDQGARLRAIVTNGTQNHQIARAIEWLKQNFHNPIKVEDLARQSGLSVSAFHTHFRAMTSMSPLQFLKRIRLNEARRLMLANHLDASKAAYEVGYESPSQFSREYSRLFGAPPIKDIKQLSANASSPLTSPLH